MTPVNDERFEEHKQVCSRSVDRLEANDKALESKIEKLIERVTGLEIEVAKTTSKIALFTGIVVGISNLLLIFVPKFLEKL